MPLEGDKLMQRDVAKLAYDAGWRGDNIVLVGAICAAESSRYTRAWNDQNPDGSTDRGLMQINSVHTGQVVDGKAITEENVFDPVFNMTIAYQLYRGASYTFRPWAAYASGAYKDYLPEAITGAANATRIRFNVPLV